MKVDVAARPVARVQSWTWGLPVLLLVGLVIRLAFIGDAGFKTDVQTFEAWAMALAERGLPHFYATAGFADYPPGYFYVLAVVGNIWETLFKSGDNGHYTILRALVKLPAILADLGVGALLYAVVRRYATAPIALGAAALYVLNPAIIFNSAAWGQVDSVSCGLALAAVACLLKSDDRSVGAVNGWIVGGWLLIAASLLIKPQAAVVLPLMLAFAFTDPARRRTRLISTAVGIVASVLLALLLAEPFHPSGPVAALSWLLGRYTYGSNVYPYNSVNAFNLWAIRGAFWQSDTQPITVFGGLSLGPQYVWGIVLVAAAVLLATWRYVQDRTSRSLLEACAVVTVAFFVLATRMHERYVFDGIAFTIVCLPFARRYLWSAIALSVVLFANLQYSLQYLYVMNDHVPGANAQNLWGAGTTLFALASVAVFFWLGYQFLGSDASRAEAIARGARPDEAGSAAVETASVGIGGRAWYDPRQGLAAMRAPLDYIVMGVFGVVNFVLSFIGYWWPQGTSCWSEGGLSRCGIFDELYFARAGEEYLQNLRIYENTHPPLTKLLVTLSTMLFGGMPHGHGLGGWTGLNAVIGHAANGDNTYGWRFLDVVFGALVVMLLYAFAKRITGSTVFAALAALFLTLDGMHFVQSRIATPEGFVIFFATFATYAFYRFWISSQTSERTHLDVPAWAYAAAAGGALTCGIVVALLCRAIWGFDTASIVLTTLYVGCGVYLLLRYSAFAKWFGDGRRELTFADGSSALIDPNGSTLMTSADGGTIDGRGKIVRGMRSTNRGGVLAYDDEALRIEYRRDATVAYQTPASSAVYAGDEIRVDGAVAAQGRSAKLWLVLFTVALGLLISSKWYGVMGFGVSFLVLIAVFAQRWFLRLRPAQWGNPRGFRFDGALLTIVFISATVYALAWLPDLVRHSPDPNEVHNVNDVVERQATMFNYHDTLKATHPYSSKWWEWPLDLVPVAYFYEDHRTNPNDQNGCCIYEITSMPNPAILWLGLLCVPWVGVLAWRERNKGYALIVLTYLLQWLPWMRSPRITFAYHFYVDIPLICLCNAIVLQRVWQWARRQETPRIRWMAQLGVAACVAAALVTFVYFYPILSAHPISWNAWHHRMWFGLWVIGPG